MPQSITTPEAKRCEQKECWHIYSLQALSPDKFIAVTEKIMKGRLQLLSHRRAHLFQADESLFPTEN